MIHINIIVLGKLKEEYWREAENEYLKRLSTFAKVNIIEVKEESFSEKDPAELIKRKEAEKITEAMEKIKDTYYIFLEEKGRQYDSVEFSKQIQKWTTDHSLTLVLGGPLGFDRDLIKKANGTLSLSPLTFTHQMARVILLEQVYRAMMIGQNRKYHY